MIYEAVWKADPEHCGAAVANVISQLRRKIGDVYIELHVDTFVVDKTTIYFLRRNDGAPQAGNYVSIYIHVKIYQKMFKFYR